jgi:hypothetical protein
MISLAWEADHLIRTPHNSDKLITEGLLRWHIAAHPPLSLVEERGYLHKLDSGSQLEQQPGQHLD